MYPLRAGEHLFRGRQPVILARLRRRLFNLPQLEGDEIEPGAFFSCVHARSIELLAQRADSAPRVPNRCRVVVETGVLVDQKEVCRGIEQRLMLMLSVELDEPPGEVAQGDSRCEGAIDERPAPTLDRYLASNDQLERFRTRLPVVLEYGFDGCLGLARADQVRRCPGAEEKSDRLDDD